MNEPGLACTLGRSAQASCSHDRLEAERCRALRRASRGEHECRRPPWGVATAAGLTSFVEDRGPHIELGGVSLEPRAQAAYHARVGGRPPPSATLCVRPRAVALVVRARPRAHDFARRDLGGEILRWRGPSNHPRKCETPCCHRPSRSEGALGPPAPCRSGCAAAVDEHEHSYGSRTAARSMYSWHAFALGSGRCRR